MGIYKKNYNTKKRLVETSICQEEIEAENVKIALVVKCGLINEKRQYGIAHLTEHMLLSFEYENKYHSYFSYSVKAITSIDKTIFEFTCLPEDIFNIIKIIRKILTGETLYESYLDDIKIDVIDEYVKVSNDYLYHINKFLLKNYKIVKTMPIGSPKEIYKVTYKMISEYFKENYIASNSGLIVCGNINHNIVEKCVDNLLAIDYINTGKINKKKQATYNKEFWNRKNIVLKHSIKNGLQEVHVFFRMPTSRGLYEIVVDNIVFTILEEKICDTFNKAKIEINRFSRYNMFFHLTISDTQASYAYLREILEKLKGIIRKKEPQLINCLKKMINDYYDLLLQHQNDLEDTLDQLIDLYLYDDEYYTENDYIDVLEKLQIDDIVGRLEKWIKQLLNRRKSVVFELRG